METFRVLEKTGKDGTLNLRIPLGKPDVECEVVVTVQPCRAYFVGDSPGATAAAPFPTATCGRWCGR